MLGLLWRQHVIKEVASVGLAGTYKVGDPVSQATFDLFTENEATVGRMSLMIKLSE